MKSASKRSRQNDRSRASVLALAAVSLWLLVAWGMPAQAEPYPGEADYMRYCSACHGETADGKGPVANVLSPNPPALTRLQAKFGKPLGTDLVTFVMGRTMPRAHGTSDMPVWGRNLAGPDGDDTQAVTTIWRIVNYLDWIQVED